MSLPDDWKWRVKAALRDLVARAGGYERAAGCAGLSKSTLHRAASADYADMPSLVAVMLLERDCGVPLVSAVLAEAQGHALVPREARETPALSRAHAIFARAAAELQAALAEALADGVVTPREQQVIEREAAGVAGALAGLRQSNARGRGKA